MWIGKKRFNALLHNQKQLQQNVHVLLETLSEYHISDRISAENPYKTREVQINETIRKFHGEANYGNQMAQRLVNLRVAFSVPNRLFLVKNQDSKASASEIKDTREYLNAFMALNGLDNDLPRNLAKEAELQGQVVARLIWNSEKKVPDIVYYPYISTKYVVEPVGGGAGAVKSSSEAFKVNPKLTLSITLSGAATENIPDDEFSFIAFNDEQGKYIGYPTVGGILITLENLDKDMRDWRKLNHLYAHPTPHFKCDSKEQADAINAMVGGTGWKVGTALATNSEFSLVGTTGIEANLLMLSIQTGAKIISGHTGISIHFLGFANVMSNRATADSMGEPTEVVLHSEISSWQNFYNDLFQKAIRMRNKQLNKELPEDAVLPRIIPLTDRQWQLMKDIYLPSYKEGLISHETFLDKMPDLDPDTELVRVGKEREQRDKRAQEMRDKIGDANNETTNPGRKIEGDGKGQENTNGKPGEL